MSRSGHSAVSSGRATSVPPGADHLTRPTRLLLAVFGLLTALGVLALLVGATRTNQSFAWTINPPLAAAFCGAGYGAGLVLVLLTLRAGRWSQARWPLLTILLFTVLTLVASLVHLGRFHFNAPGVLAVAAAWFWMTVYVVVPVGMAAVLVVEERRVRAAARSSSAGAPGPADGGADRRSARPRQPTVYTAFLVAQGVLLTLTGALLFLGVKPVLDAWPWALTPLVGMVTGAWLVSFGVAALLATRVDIRALEPANAGYLTFGVLQVVAVALYRGDVRSGAAVTLYLLVAGWVAATGAWGLQMARARRGR